MDDVDLVREAILARENAYTPYSHFAVGAALLSADGRVWHGCNIENASYTPTNCAERTAFFKAVSEGTREFAAIAIVGGAAGLPISSWCAPCGVCRQVMEEFCDPQSFRVVLAASPHQIKPYLLKDLLPLGFGPQDLEAAQREADGQ